MGAKHSDSTMHLYNQELVIFQYFYIDFSLTKSKLSTLTIDGKMELQ